MEQKEEEEKSQADSEIFSEDDPLSDFERDYKHGYNQEDSVQRGSPSLKREAPRFVLDEGFSMFNSQTPFISSVCNFSNSLRSRHTPQQRPQQQRLKRRGTPRFRKRQLRTASLRLCRPWLRSRIAVGMICRR